VSELIMPPAWIVDAPCARVDGDLWFPDKGEAADSRAAKRICNGDPKRGTEPCPLRERCLQWATSSGQLWGVWGGLTARERRNLRGAAA
jgi:WhiB family redox-sensing transcriptional regulator